MLLETAVVTVVGYLRGIEVILHLHLLLNFLERPRTVQVDDLSLVSPPLIHGRAPNNSPFACCHIDCNTPVAITTLCK